MKKVRWVVIEVFVAFFVHNFEKKFSELEKSWIVKSCYINGLKFDIEFCKEINFCFKRNNKTFEKTKQKVKIGEGFFAIKSITVLISSLQLQTPIKYLVKSKYKLYTKQGLIASHSNPNISQFSACESLEVFGCTYISVIISAKNNGRMG